MQRYFLLFSYAVVLYCLNERCTCAQIKSTAVDSVVQHGDTQVTRYRVGASVTAKRGAVRDVLAIVAVPLACPEQEVELIDEDISNYVDSHDYRLLQRSELLGNGARQMLIRIPHLPNKAEAHAILTFEVRTRIILPPEETSELVIPKKPPRELKRYLGKSPFIETKHSKFKKLTKKIFAKLEGESTQGEDASVETTGELASAGGPETPEDAPPPSIPPPPPASPPASPTGSVSKPSTNTSKTPSNTKNKTTNLPW